MSLRSWASTTSVRAGSDQGQSESTDRLNFQGRTDLAHGRQVASHVPPGAQNPLTYADSHYQLANRLATAHVLVACGYHAVPIYLGFTGDTYFRDYFRDADHWQRAMGAYLHRVLPLHWPETTTSHESGGSVTMHIATLPVISISQRL